MNINVFIVDDQPVVRAGLKLLLSLEGIKVCGETGDCAVAIKHLSDLSPDIFLIELALEGQNTLAFIAEMYSRGHKVLVYSIHESAEYIQSAFSAGAAGYVTKREVSEVIANAVREVFEGRRYTSACAAQNLATAFISGLPKPGKNHLSQREKQIMDSLGLGCTTSEISEMLGISPRTVESYCSRIIIKLDLTGMRDLKQCAIRKRKM
jgi:DNA-binding NarL/FixJ family response regulator